VAGACPQAPKAERRSGHTGPRRSRAEVHFFSHLFGPVEIRSYANVAFAKKLLPIWHSLRKGGRSPLSFELSRIAAEPRGRKTKWRSPVLTEERQVYPLNAARVAAHADLSSAREGPTLAWPTRSAASHGDTRGNGRFGHLRRFLREAARCWRFPSLLRNDTLGLRYSRALTSAQTPTLNHHMLSSGATGRCAESSSSSAHRGGPDKPRGNRPNRSAFGNSDEVSGQMIADSGRTASVQDAANVVLGVP
jgi:hypothetical protein